MTKKIVFAALAVVLVAGVGAFLVLRPEARTVETTAADPPGTPAAAPEPEGPSLHSNEPMALAIDRAAAFLATRPLSADVYWLAKRAGHLLGGEFNEWEKALAFQDNLSALRMFGYPIDAIEAWMSSYDFTAKPLPSIPAPEGLTPVNAVPDLQRETIQRIIRVSVLGLKCALECEPDSVATLLEEVQEPSTDYILTHQVLSLMLAYHYGCITLEQLAPPREALATATLQELMGDERFTDLTAERMAMLALAGHANWIPDKYIELAINSQLPDGSWPDFPILGEQFSMEGLAEHAAALTLFAMAHRWLEAQAG